MNEITAVRTPQIVAAEINSIKDQTRTMILCNSIEIGRRLVEAKSMVEHGEWGDWLEKSVDYKKSTANNLMKIFEEYGANQIALFGDNAKSQALGNLSYTQAVALLGVPDREEFMKENDIENMSTRQLQEAIKAQKAAEKQAEDMYKVNQQLVDKQSEKDFRLQEAEQKAIDLQKEFEEKREQSKSEVDLLTNMLAAASNKGTSNKKIQKIEAELKAAQQQVQELTSKINEPVTIEPVIIEKVPEEIEQELDELREKNKDLEAQASRQSTEVLKFGIYFDSLTAGFKGLLGSLAEIKEIDMEKYDKYKNAVNGLLGKMSEKLL